LFGQTAPTTASVWTFITRFREEENIMKAFLDAAKGHLSPEATKSRNLVRKEQEF
jgi:hypothetical protein